MPNLEILIEKLKGVVLDLHRSAGSLDNIIQYIENEGREVSNEEYLKVYILAQAAYRKDVKHCLYEGLDEKEELIWAEMTDMVKKES